MKDIFGCHWLGQWNFAELNESTGKASGTVE